MTIVITRLPVSLADNPDIWRIVDGQWMNCGALDQYQPHVEDGPIMALVPAADVHCSWLDLPDLEPRQAEGVARLRIAEKSLGPVHVVARHLENVTVCAAVSPALLSYGLDRLTVHGVNPDIVLPVGLALDCAPDEILRASFEDMTFLRGSSFSIPDEEMIRNLIIGDRMITEMDTAAVRQSILDAVERPLVNLRQGQFAKRESIVWATDNQRKWITRLLSALIAATILIGLLTWAKYTFATASENERAILAAQKIDPSIQDVSQAELLLDRALQQKGLAKGRFGSLSAGLWRALKTAPNVTLRDLRFGNDGIVTAVLSAPNADSINKALLAIQQDGFRITATPRQDSSGATLVDLTMRMP